MLLVEKLGKNLPTETLTDHSLRLERYLYLCIIRDADTLLRHLTAVKRKGACLCSKSKKAF